MEKNIKEKALAGLTEKLSNARDKKEEAKIIYNFAYVAYKHKEKGLKKLAHKYFTLAADQNDDYEIKKGAHICLAQYFGETERAEKYFKKIAQQTDDIVQKAEALYALATYTDDLSEKEQCLYQVANQDECKDLRSHAWNYLAELFREQKREKEAQECFLKAFNQNDNERMKLIASYNLGAIYFEKDPKEAEKYLKIAVNQDQDLEVKEEALKWLIRFLVENRRDVEAKKYEEEFLKCQERNLMAKTIEKLSAMIHES